MLFAALLLRVQLLAFFSLAAAAASSSETEGEEQDRCSSAVHIDFSGSDILPPYPPAVASAAACCAKCKEHADIALGGCVAFSYDLAGGACYLKSSDVKPSGNTDRLSAWVNSSCPCDGAAPEPAATCWDAPHPCTPAEVPTPPPAPTPAPPPGPDPRVLARYSCLPGGPDAALPHCDVAASAAVRVEAAVGNMSVAELVASVRKQAVPRLHLPAYAMWSNEALHGVRLWPERCPFADRCTTIFPTASTAARSFNDSLVHAIGLAIGTEARVLYNRGITADLSLRGPQVNIQRDPRWGRNSNSPSEDPLVTAKYGVHLVQGAQTRDGGGPSGAGGARLINSQMKHWTGYGVEANRFGFNGNFSVHDLSETYMVPLQRMAAEANVSSAMCSYNAVNGTPMCANGWMSGSVLREAWGWQGVIESDCGALSNIASHHHYAADKLHAAAASMVGTVDVECDSVYSSSLQAAYDGGLVALAQLRAAATRILAHQFALGLFDDPRGSRWYADPAMSDAATVHSAAHARLAREAAQQGVVLVQNPGGMLPLSGGLLKKLALVGPLGNITDVFLGDYRPAACPGPAQKAPAGTACLPTLLQLLQKRAGNTAVGYAPGCTDGPGCAQLDLGAANATMAAADIIVLALGEKVTDNDSGGNTGGEGKDRSAVGLPGRQAQLVSAALATGKPVVALLLSGGAVSVDALSSPAGEARAAVLYPGFGGESGQDALVDVLFGDAEASGRLTWTVVPESWGDATAMGDMSMQAGGQGGRSYKYFNGSALFEFGAGLSYTTFQLAMIPTAGPVALSPRSTSVCVESTNVGSRASPVVVTAFASADRADLESPPRILPLRKLVGWQKSLTEPNAGSAHLCFALSDADVAFVDDAGAHIAYAGSYTLTFFDGATKVSVGAFVAARRVISTLPPPDNPQPPCCSGSIRTCC